MSVFTWNIGAIIKNQQIPFIPDFNNKYPEEIKGRLLNKLSNQIFINNMQIIREIRDTIKNKKTKIGANGKDYLILELEKGDSIFAFDNYDTP
ncbi:MAG: hypothetical protein LBR43_00700, partial [Spiroplasmataceae bacterium]|nr:hypothetical protein [Spiroplasmataceae bacterium]